MKKILFVFLFLSISFCSKDEDSTNSNKCIVCPYSSEMTSDLEGLCVGAKMPDDETGEIITLDETTLELMLAMLNAFEDTGCELK